MSDHDYWLSRGDDMLEEPEEADADLDSLEQTPEGMGYDPRDLTPAPPAYLDPRAVHRMQQMVKDAGANGDRPWPYVRDAA